MSNDSKPLTQHLSFHKTFPLLLAVLFLLAGWARTYHLDWDNGTHLHPDERYITMVAAAIAWPASPGLYWDTEHSSLNPTNAGQPDYVYGTFPLFLTRALAEQFDAHCTRTDACPTGLYTGYAGIHLLGRALSVLADLATLLLLALLGRRLYGPASGLLAAALYAFAVLPIQHAHFFVVDSFVTVFVVATLYACVRSIQTGKLTDYLLAGFTTGLALACKVSVWPLAGLIILIGFLRYERTTPENYRFRINFDAIVSVIITSCIALLVFRIAQPYAFYGPGFFGVRLNSDWIEKMHYIRNLMSGAIDMPPGHQWANRAPIWFPWRNMVFWGLGLPLGLTAWIGWGTLAYHIVRRKDALSAVPWLWATLFFFYQSTQWVKSMRYLLPVYPLFVLFAAWLLVRLATGPRPAWLRRLPQFILQTLPWLVLIGTALWALAFLQIYRRPVTRIEASQWMYRNIPAFATLHTTDGSTQQIPLRSGEILGAGAPAVRVMITLEEESNLQQITLNRVSSVGLAGQRLLRLTLSSDPGFATSLATADISVELTEFETTALTFHFAPLALPQHTLFLSLELLQGEPLTFGTSIIANEHWDDGLPLRLDGNDPYWNWYQGLQSSPDGQLSLYHEDTYEKRLQLFNWLDEADYIVLSSNRLYASIPRLPQRYPFTTAYYAALFDGSLGFELLIDFVSFPSLGPCQFPDQEAPFPIPQARYTNALPCSIPYPPAEEAFSVYDHPRVLVFAKTPAYSRANAMELLPESLLDNVQWMTPRQVSQSGGKNGNRLLMDTTLRSAQESGGTWAHLFSWNALHNRYPFLAVLLWWLLMTLLGWMAFPWLMRAFPALHDRGYGLARIIGLLLWAYVSWLPSALRLVPYTQLWLWMTFGALLLGAYLLARKQRAELLSFLRQQWQDLLRIEVLFAGLYLLWVLIRYLNPDLRHPFMGGEKPMDFAYLNAIIRATYFPPYDPWFAGGVLNYYYYGFIMVVTLIKSTGIVPSIAYNLAVPGFFAMVGTGAYSIAANLAGGSPARRARAGLWGVALTLLLGNLGQLQLLFKGFQDIGNITFESLIPGYSALVSALVGLWKVIVEGHNLGFRQEWWYWNATRVIPTVGPYDPGAINEFPMFTFLYGDLHAHMMALPLTQVALAIALQWGLSIPAFKVKDATPQLRKFLQRFDLRAWLPTPWPTFLLAALIAGALRTTNTWDYPTYWGLMSLGYLLCLVKPLWERHLSDEDPASLPPIPYQRLLTPVLILLAAELLFRPFTAHFATAYTSFSPWHGPQTPLGSYLIMHGHFIVPLVVLGVAQLLLLIQHLRRVNDPSIDFSLGIIALTTFILTLLLARMGVQAAWVAIPLGVIASFLALEPHSTSRTRLLWLWVGTALALTLLVELVVLEGDIGRMNTVFKFYLQVWMLLAAAAAVAVERLIDYGFQVVVRQESTEHSVQPLLNRLPVPVVDAILGLLVALLFATALYPLLATPARARDRWNPEAPHTLDGMAYMPFVTQYEQGQAFQLDTDYRLIRWLLENVEGSPVIMEMNATVEYLTWGNRVSIYTGLPGVVGWRWQQAQQRTVMPAGVVEQRQYAISEFYTTPDPYLAQDILRRYNVQYVILTDYERAYMTPLPLDPNAETVTSPELAESKFKTLVEWGYLQEVYRDGSAIIYRVQ